MIKKYLIGFLLFEVLLINSPFAFAQIIEDEIAKEAFKGQTFTKPVYQNKIIEDESEISLKNSELKKNVFKKTMIEDDLIKNNPHMKNCKKLVFKQRLIDENAQIIKISIHSTVFISPKNEIKIGQNLTFAVAKDIYKNKKLFIKKDTPVKTYVELISKAGYYGDPDELELGRFSTKDINGNIIELDGTIRKQGADRSKWAKPLYYIGASAPYPCGGLMMFYFVKGGKVKIKTNEFFDLYYE